MLTYLASGYCLFYKQIAPCYYFLLQFLSAKIFLVVLHREDRSVKAFFHFPGSDNLSIKFAFLDLINLISDGLIYSVKVLVSEDIRTVVYT